MSAPPKLRAPNVAELKAQRIVYLTGQIEILQSAMRSMEVSIRMMTEEKSRLVKHIGYDPTQGKVPATEEGVKG